MNKIFIVLLFLAFSGQTFCQVDTTSRYTSIKADLLKKSKTQRTVGWVLLGTGTSMIITGGLVGLNSIANEPPFGEEDALTAGGIFLVVGIAADLVSIPFFVSASKNKKRAATIALKMENVPKSMQGKIVQSPMTSISFRLSF